MALTKPGHPHPERAGEAPTTKSRPPSAAMQRDLPAGPGAPGKRRAGNRTRGRRPPRKPASRSRRRNRPVLLATAAALAVLGVVPANAYKYFGADLRIVLGPAAAVRWAPGDLPVRFRLLENERLPEHPDLTPRTWREMVARALGSWTEVPTARVTAVLEEQTVRSDFVDTDDGINTVGFAGDEFSGIARAGLRIEGGRIVGCDVVLNHRMLEVLEDREEENPQRIMEWLPRIETIVAHEFGHCFGLAHSDLNPAWEATPSAPPAARGNGFYPEEAAAFHANPVMSYGGAHGFVGLAPDDRTGISLLYPAPGYLESTGAIGGRLVFADGRGASFVYLQIVDGVGADAAFGAGAFTDAIGQFLLEGLPPGRRLFWAHPIGNLRAHYGPDRFGDADILRVLDIRDRWFWAEVRAGQIEFLPPLTVSTGRTTE